MRVYIHTFVVRIVSDKADSGPFADRLADVSSDDHALSLTVDTIPLGIAHVPDMPMEYRERGTWIADHAEPLIGPAA